MDLNQVFLDKAERSFPIAVREGKTSKEAVQRADVSILLGVRSLLIPLVVLTEAPAHGRLRTPMVQHLPLQ